MTVPADDGQIWRPHARFRAHTPVRPAFRCRTCGVPWPCQPVRLSLLLAFRDNRLGLFTYLAAQLHRATHDLPNVDSAELAVRFFGWVPRARTDQPNDRPAQGPPE
ncbi:hypothetical protein ACQEVC_15135 [Plantactinospora sp. CA-294935]|uniref:hypothetical protein n=1 Tax=Plantactinospora sp. CA-294935 TaxID=3240012 RepID=UPI003D938138